MINIGLHSEYVLSLYGVLITNTFLTSVLVTFFLSLIAVIFSSKIPKRKGMVANGLTVAVYELLNLVDTVTEDRELSKKILPVVSTFFFFIVTANLLALLPGFLGSVFVATQFGEVSLLRSPNSDLTTTIALALFSVISIQFFSLRILGIKKYLGRFFNFGNPIKFILGFFELVSEGVKVLSFSFRLFGNVFAGEVLLLVIAFLVPYLIPLPFMILEVFVGIIQAFIFAILTLTFIKTSTLRHMEPSG